MRNRWGQKKEHRAREKERGTEGDMGTEQRRFGTKQKTIRPLSHRVDFTHWGSVR